MKLTQATQEALLSILCFAKSKKQAAHARSLVRPKDFDPFYSDIATEADAYYEKYGVAPGSHTLDIVNGLMSRSEERAKIFKRIFNVIYATSQDESFNPDYTLRQARLFARVQRMKAGCFRTMELLEHEPDEAKVNEAEAALSGCVQTTAELFDPGIRVNDRRRALRYLDEDKNEVLATGIPEIDRFELGPARQRLHVLFALYGKGKSWWLTWLAKQALIQRWRTLYISLELKDTEVVQRIHQCLFAVSKRRQDLKYTHLVKDDLGRAIDIQFEQGGERPSLQDEDIRSVMKRKLRKLDQRPPIIVKNFPTGSVTMRDITAYLDALAATEGFVPDLLLVDYPDLMRFNPKYRREEIGEAYKQLRGLGMERNIAVAVPTQSNRSGEGAQLLKGNMVGEDFSKLQTADVFFSYTQTDAEHQLNLARLYALKGRTDQDRFKVAISQSYATGQFCMSSALMAENPYWSFVKREGDEPQEDEDE